MVTIHPCVDSSDRQIVCNNAGTDPAKGVVGLIVHNEPNGNDLMRLMRPKSLIQGLVYKPLNQIFIFCLEDDSFYLVYFPSCVKFIFHMGLAAVCSTLLWPAHHK